MRSGKRAYPLSAYAYLACTIGMMIVVFFFSDQNSAQSLGLSGGIIQRVVTILQEFLPAEWFAGIDTTDLGLWSVQFFVRKAAHITEYAFLAFFATLSLRDFGLRRYPALAGVFCVLYACFDEFNQFLGGTRTGCLGDVGMDSIGIALGVVTVVLFTKLARKRRASRASCRAKR